MSRQYSSKDKRKSASPMRRVYLTAAVLLLAVYVTSMLTAAPLAKYVSSAKGSDSVNVAKFVVETAASESTELSLITNNTVTTPATYTFNVSNVKDTTVINGVTTNYDVVVTLPQKIDGVAPSLTNGTTSVTGTSSDNITYTFANAGTFKAGVAETQSLTLTFTLTAADAVTGKYEGIQIDVNAVQAD